MPARPNTAPRWILVALVALIAATGCTEEAPPPDSPAQERRPTATGSSPGSHTPGLPSGPPRPAGQWHRAERPRILFLGNSHTVRHDLPGTIADLLREGRPPVHARVTVAPGLLHLDERASDPTTVRLMRSQPWDVVVMQAQNYSLSGTTDYPSHGSVALVRAARARGAMPVLFAEWPRRGVDETPIILDAYREISRREPACLPPVPETFDHATGHASRLRLLAEDGNHSSAAGAFLAALVLASTIGGEDVATLPRLRSSTVPAKLQHRLRQLAAAELRRIPATRGCPGSEARRSRR